MKKNTIKKSTKRTTKRKVKKTEPFKYFWGSDKDIIEFDPSEIKEAGVLLSTNNSGGDWWLDYKDEAGLKSEGWKVNIVDRLGRHAAHAFLPNADIQKALISFRIATKYTGKELGCGCCGVPFSFTQHDDKGKLVESWRPSYPSEGDDYI